VPGFEIRKVDGVSVKSVSVTVNVFSGLPLAEPVYTTVLDGG
jgi:hypothetical protein